MIADEKKFLSTLSEVFRRNGMAGLLNKERAEKFLRLAEYMLTENEKYNLTAITEPDAIILQHFADCATLAARLPQGVTVADVGCGAGFPTLPLAIVRDDLRITAMDSTAKRVDFVTQSARLLSLGGVRTLCIRAEDAGRDSALRERFDRVVARAVAPMRILCELCVPLIRVGGQLIAMKGKNASFELAEAKRAVSMLGACAQPPVDITLSSEKEVLSHTLLMADKKTKTPAAYPRPYSQISKKPL